MKTSIKQLINHFGLTFLVMLTAFVWAVGCAGLGHHPDPLAGWKVDFHYPPNQTIVNDYQDYIQKLPPGEKKYLGPSEYFEDGTGQHAVRISVLLNGTEWAHILIYDKDNKRIRVIKYAAGRYMS